MKSPDEEIKTARDAERLLNDPIFKSAIQRIETHLIECIRQVAMADITTQHELVLSLQLLTKLRNNINAMIQTGRMAEIQKEQASIPKGRRNLRS